ncbi:hypothetical protein AZE42_07689 [Rhizopogon vesiculosus]|uniref:Uncharacterized protein n=1 Tax=Rhizopogon vesiculosus TaxID=180088 RepID=A0A1J8Q9U8_9AGAM|nr:hypothetical protein AZE42_07689 [Rhizopogon vesiculosus]
MPQMVQFLTKILSGDTPGVKNGVRYTGVYSSMWVTIVLACTMSFFF